MRAETHDPDRRAAPPRERQDAPAHPPAYGRRIDCSPRGDEAAPGLPPRGGRPVEDGED